MFKRYYKYRWYNSIALLLMILLASFPAVFAKSGAFNPESAGKMFDVLLKDRMGVTVRSVTPKETEKYKLNIGQGVAIVWLEPGGSLRQAGLELDDILLKVNNEPINSIKSLAGFISPLKSNKQITLFALDHRSGHTGYVEVIVH